MIFYWSGSLTFVLSEFRPAWGKLAAPVPVAMFQASHCFCRSFVSQMDPVQKAVINHTFGVPQPLKKKQIISCNICHLRFNSTVRNISGGKVTTKVHISGYVINKMKVLSCRLWVVCFQMFFLQLPPSCHLKNVAEEGRGTFARFSLFELEMEYNKILFFIKRKNLYLFHCILYKSFLSLKSVCEHEMLWCEELDSRESFRLSAKCRNNQQPQQETTVSSPPSFCLSQLCCSAHALLTQTCNLWKAQARILWHFMHIHMKQMYNSSKSLKESSVWEQLNTHTKEHAFIWTSSSKKVWSTGDWELGERRRRRALCTRKQIPFSACKHQLKEDCHVDFSFSCLLESTNPPNSFMHFY